MSAHRYWRLLLSRGADVDVEIYDQRPRLNAARQQSAATIQPQAGLKISTAVAETIAANSAAPMAVGLTLVETIAANSAAAMAPGQALVEAIAASTIAKLAVAGIVVEVIVTVGAQPAWLSPSRSRRQLRFLPEFGEQEEPFRRYPYGQRYAPISPPPPLPWQMPQAWRLRLGWDEGDTQDAAQRIRARSVPTPRAVSSVINYAVSVIT